MLPVAVNVPVDGLKSSALAVSPPAISTCPFCNSVAVCPRCWRKRAAGRRERAGRRIKELRDQSSPPAIRTLPWFGNVEFASSVALRVPCASVMLPVAVNV